jgi:DNA primase
MSTYESAKEQVKGAADIVELIGQFVQLKKTGRNYVGLCPFHAEKAPSFTVSPEKQIFHCFGCKKGGDVFSFWMAYHNATFPEAMKDLAERYQVELPEGSYSAKDKEITAMRETLFQINEQAARYFQKALRDPAQGKRARSYLEKRFLPQDLIAEFSLGYAPDEWDGLTRFLKGRGADPAMACRAGLIIPKKSGGHYDRFRGRIMYPIFNMRHQVIGFGGRVLDDSMPKYLNTPETPLFRKGEMPYGLHSSFHAIRERKRAVVVEGYMDFLALRRHGLPEVVATLGTAITAEHVRKLKGYADTIVMVFDSDEAGRSAVLNSVPLFANEGVSARAVVLPDGHDPDSFVNQKGLESLTALLDNAPFLLDFYMEQRLREKKDDVERKVTILKEMLPVLSALNDSAQRALIVKRLSERLGLQESVIWVELKNFSRGATGATIEKNVRERLTASTSTRKFDELHLLHLLVHYPETIPKLMAAECQLLMTDAVVLEIVDVLFTKCGGEGAVSMEKVGESLSGEAARQQFREILMGTPRYSREEVSQAVADVEHKVHQKKISAYVQKAKGDAEALNQVLELKRIKDKNQQVRK